MRFLFCLCLINIAWAQGFQITEISPHNLGEQSEWLEFRVDQEVDLSQYQVSNGKNLPKSLESAVLGASEGYYYFEKSPVSLANDGGVIQILDLADVVLHEVNYPKTKSGTKDGKKWVETWNWSEKYQQFLPLISKFSPGQKNLKLPTPSDQFTLLFSEASPDRNFLEFYLDSGPGETNLKYTKIKHNGTTLKHFETDYIISPGDYILVEGPVAGGSGSVEIITHSHTSLENVEDFVCWQDEALSKTELSRVKKFKITEDWSGDCYEYGASILNESIARVSVDTNTKEDLQPHYNGSPGSENTIQNQPPVAVITIQGSGKSLGTPPFSLNVTGENSTDPDGIEDLKTFVWTLDGEIFSQESNPKNIKLEQIKNYDLKLTVTDHSGASSTMSETIFVTAGVSAPSAKNSAEFVAHLEAAIEKVGKNNQKLPAAVEENFFAPVLQNETFMAQLFIKKDPAPVYPDYEPLSISVETKTEAPFGRRIKLPLIVRERLHRNLGLIWDWRETQWAGAVGSISDGAIDRNSERFAVAFGVP